MAGHVRRRRAFWLIALLSLVGTVAFLRTRVAWDSACELARTQLPKALNAEVDIGACELNPLRRSVVLKDLSIRPAPAGRVPRR